MICKDVVTYYVDVPGLWGDESQRALIALWKRSWEKYGWTATCLEEADVRSHPRFEFFNAHFRAKPTEYGVPYTTACFMRWLAASHWAAPRSGFCLLTDYDVISHGCEPFEIEPGKMTVFADSPPSSIFMGMVAGSTQNFLDMAELFCAWTPDALDWNHAAQLFHQDDLNMLTRCFDSKTRPKPDWLVRANGCALWDFSSSRTSKACHYGFALKQAGYWPKHEWIEKLRPI